MSADAWETCPLCHAVEAVREDYEIWLNEDGTVNIHFRAVCRKCGTRWEIDSNIHCQRA